jgi:hypothetical protein
MQKVVEAAADLAGIAQRTGRRASKEMEIRKWQESRCWWWELR